MCLYKKHAWPPQLSLFVLWGYVSSFSRLWKPLQPLKEELVLNSAVIVHLNMSYYNSCIFFMGFRRFKIEMLAPGFFKSHNSVLCSRAFSFSLYSSIVRRSRLFKQTPGPAVTVNIFIHFLVGSTATTNLGRLGRTTPWVVEPCWSAVSGQCRSLLSWLTVRYTCLV